MATGVFTCVRCGTSTFLAYQGEDGRCCWCDGMDRGIAPRTRVTRVRHVAGLVPPIPAGAEVHRHADSSATVVERR